MKNFHDAIRRCHRNCLLLLGAVLACDLALLVFVPTNLVQISLAVGFFVATFFGVFSWDLARKEKRREARYPEKLLPTDCVVMPVLAAAMQDDLDAIARSVDLKPSPKLYMREAHRSIAYIEQSLLVGRPSRIFLSTDLLKLKPSRDEVRSLLAHEIGHRLLNTRIWLDQAVGLVCTFSFGVLVIPMVRLALTFVEGVSSHLSTSLTGALMATVVVLLAALIFLCLGYVVAIVSRNHERGCDDISAALIGPGLLASLLLKRESLLLHKGLRSHGKITPSWQGLKNLYFRIYATHPSLFERVERNRGKNRLGRVLF